MRIEITLTDENAEWLADILSRVDDTDAERVLNNLLFASRENLAWLTVLASSLRLQSVEYPLREIDLELVRTASVLLKSPQC